MGKRLVAKLEAHPYLVGFAAAFLVYAMITAPIGFTFMADD